MTRGLVVWVALAAFCVCLLAPSAFARSRPYDIKTVTHVKKDVDDGGWGIPVAMPNRPEAGIYNSGKAKPATFSFATLFSRIWNLNFNIVQPPVEPQTKESAQW
jgi:hypothetical protein